MLITKDNGHILKLFYKQFLTKKLKNILIKLSIIIKLSSYNSKAINVTLTHAQCISLQKIQEKVY